MEITRLQIIFIIGLMAFAVRAVPQIFFVGEKFPEVWDRWLRYLSYGFICSIISVTLFMSGARFETAAAPRRGIGLRHSNRLQNQKRGDRHDLRRSVGFGSRAVFVAYFTHWSNCPCGFFGSAKRSDEERFLAMLEMTIREFMIPTVCIPDLN